MNDVDRLKATLCIILALDALPYQKNELLTFYRLQYHRDEFEDEQTTSSVNYSNRGRLLCRISFTSIK